MHMTCRSCKFEFCWLCNGDWRQHGQNTGGYYDCNKFKQSDVRSCFFVIKRKKWMKMKGLLRNSIFIEIDMSNIGM